MTARLIDLAAAADYLGRTPGAVRKLVYRREIPFVKQGRTLRFDLRQLDDWIASHTVAAET